MLPSIHTPILVLDPGLGTTLTNQPHNQSFDTSTPLWSSHLLITSPSTLSAAHASFVDAGADVILTATYQASFEGFSRTKRSGRRDDEAVRSGKEEIGEESGYGRDEATQYMRSAVPLAVSAFSAPTLSSPRQPRIALSLGAYGATLTPSAEYSGVYPASMSTRSALTQWHADRLSVFTSDEPTWDSVEFVAFETVRKAEEVRGIRDVMAGLQREGKGGKIWWICCVVPREVTEQEEVRGLVRAMLAPTLSEQGAEEVGRPWGVGVNCSSVSKVSWVVSVFEEEVRRMVEQHEFVNEWENGNAVGPWLVIYPDGADGLVYNTSTMEWEEGGDKVDGEWDEMVWNVVKGARDSGVWAGVVVGGCCKTGPEEIRRLRLKVDAGG